MNLYEIIGNLEAEIRNVEAHLRYLVKRKHELIQNALNPPMILTEWEWKAIQNSRVMPHNQPAPQPAPVVDPFEEAMKIVAAERRTGGTRE